MTDVRIISFSYKNGDIPPEAHMVEDVREVLTNNPHYIEALRPMTGLEEEVGRYITEHNPRFSDYFDRLKDKAAARLRESRSGPLVVALGCTGGRHRSVFVADRLRADLQDRGYAVEVEHRELSRRETCGT